MNTYLYPAREDWKEIVRRPTIDNSQLRDTVAGLLQQIREGGDKVLKELEARFDHCTLDALRVTDAEMQEARQAVAPALAEAIGTASRNIAAFHEAQRFAGVRVETQPGVVCWQKSVPIGRVGLYVPGGTAPLFSTVLMLAIPAHIAGCKEIVLCSPPNREGKVHPAILFAAQASGVNKIFKIGGIQAIAAMTYGTESVPKVYKIFGPGNQYVTAAKQLVSLRDVAIDMPAGPSEVEVIADGASNPEFIAADFLSQAEHGADSQAIMLTSEESIVAPTKDAIRTQLAALPRKDITEKALSHSRIIVLRNEQEVVDFTNMYAPEHLIIQTKNYAAIAEQINNAGSVFLGPYTPESAGDYASGTNHTLPTNGYAKAYSGVNLDSFIKKMTFQEITSDGIKSLGSTIQTMAAGEQLDAHRNAVTIRIESL